MHEWQQLFKITVALLAIVNPFGGIPVFIGATRGWPARERARTARTVALTVFLVLMLAAFLGDRLLDFFNVSIGSFMVGGGILILLLAISMLQARESPIRQTPEEAVEVADRQAIGVVPLGVPLLAGPGAISSVIIAAHQFRHGDLLGHVLLLIPIITVTLVVWGVFLLGSRIARRLGRTGLNIVTRLMGLILAAMAVETIARGLMELFPRLA
ncbi:MAG: NAAT family transporter [Burkholderiales bacterium]|jgi:multiple antibiotic resistance protein|nr:NAAT family transporter [Burkholderiales bacterium]